MPNESCWARVLGFWLLTYRCREIIQSQEWRDARQNGTARSAPLQQFDYDIRTTSSAYVQEFKKKNELSCQQNQRCIDNWSTPGFQEVDCDRFVEKFRIQSHCRQYAKSSTASHCFLDCPFTRIAHHTLADKPAQRWSHSVLVHAPAFGSDLFQLPCCLQVDHLGNWPKEKYW